MVRFSIALASFLINPRRLSYFCVVGTVKTGFSSSEEADKGSVKLLLLLLFNTLLLLLLLMLFFLSSTHPFNGLESSVMDKPNVPATIPPIKKGKFSDMTSKMSSFSLLFEDAIRPKVVLLVNTERCGVCLFLSRTFAPLAEDDDDEKEEEEEEDVVANVVVVVLIVRAVSIVFLSRILWTCTSLWNSARRRVAKRDQREIFFVFAAPSKTQHKGQKAVSKKEKRKKKEYFSREQKKELFVSRQSSV
jgi:hypothetical protein